MKALPISDMITPIRYAVLVALRDILTLQGNVAQALLYARLLHAAMPGVEEMNTKLSGAISAMSNGDFDTARLLLTEIQSSVPDAADAGSMLGVLEYLECGNPAEQIENEHGRRFISLQVFLLPLFCRDRVLDDITAADFNRFHRFRLSNPCAMFVG